MQPKIKRTDCFLVLGRRGVGKSYLSSHIHTAYPRVVIFDTVQEHDQGLIVFNFEQFTRAVLALENEPKLRIIFRFDPSSSNHDEVFNQALRVIYEWGNIHVVIEEVQNFATPHHIPHWLRNCLLIGRHRDISLHFTTQRPGELHKTILSQCDHIFVGQTIEKNDVLYIASFLNEDAKKLLSLKPREFYYFTPGLPIQKITNDLQVINTL